MAHKTGAASGFLRWYSVKEPPANAGDLRNMGLKKKKKKYGFDPWVGKIPWRRAWQPIPVLLPVLSHGQRSQEGYTVHWVAERQTQLKQRHAPTQGQAPHIQSRPLQ